MIDYQSRRRILQLSSTAIVSGVAGCFGLGEPSPEEQARSQKETLSKYTDVKLAQQDGYVMSVPYVRKSDGNLGLPFIKPDAQKLEPEQPNGLFYELRSDGTFELAGVEWYVPTDETDSAPSLFGKTLEGPTDGETGFIPRHYGLHAWLFVDNPNGLFAATNPELSPPPFIDQLDTVWNKFATFYLNPEKAQNEGYRNTENCIATDAGGYGVPYENSDNIGTKLTEPPILLYRLTSTWNYQMMGAEWYISADSTDSPPELFGRKFHDPMEGHSPNLDQESHYGLHTWFFTANPEGMFAPFNPTIRC